MTESNHPLVDAVRRAREGARHPLQIPGHKYRYSQNPTTPGFELLHELVRDDMPYQGGADDLYAREGSLVEAEALYARTIGADHTRFLVGGSSQANIAAMLTVGLPDQPIAVDRTSHRSQLAGLVLSGARPEWLFPEIHPELGLPIGVSPETLASLQGPVTAVCVTSPSYVGSIGQIAELATTAHGLGTLLVVDQAWGAHLDYLPGRGALAQGADLAVTSIHKALMGYSATAIVSCQSARVDPHRLDRSVDLTATTSPSATLLASIDATRYVMATRGAELLARASEATAELRRELSRVPGLVVVDDTNLGVPVDPLKLVLWLPRTGVTGMALHDALWAQGTSVEAADADTIIMTISPVDEPDWVLAQGPRLAALVEKYRSEPRDPSHAVTWQVRPDVVITPREAMFAPRRRIPMADAIGEISAEQFCPYPPGVPLLGPGERVTAELVEALHLAGATGRVAYCSDASLRTIEVVDG